MSWTGERPFHVVRKTVECDGVASLVLKPARGALAEFEPGQYLTVVVEVPGEPRPLVRCYSLSAAPDGETYRITVKRVGPPPGSDAPPGRASTHLVERVGEGDVLAVRAPNGTFSLPRGQSGPVVLIGGGIGVTPLMGMVEGLVARGERRPTWLVLGFRSGAEHPFAQRLAALAGEHPWLHLVVCYSQPAASDVLGRAYHRRGRVTVERLTEILPPADAPYAFYVCGPAAMMADLTDGLEERGVPASAIHVEAFGAGSVRPLTRRLERRLEESDGGERSVTFARSGKTVPWDPEASSVLDLALANDVFFPFACAAGHCGTCSSRLLAGEVAYPVEPQYPFREGHCLPCIAVPKTSIEVDV